MERTYGFVKNHLNLRLADFKEIFLQQDIRILIEDSTNLKSKERKWKENMLLRINNVC